MTQISRELVALAAMRQARATFFRKLEDHATSTREATNAEPHSRDQRKLIRSDGVAQIAEFFFVLREGGVTTPEALRQFILRHNEDMEALLATCERGYTVGGLSKERIEKSIFSERQIDYLMHECQGGEPRFDQQSLQRIFTQSMSFETCRKLVILLAEGGFLNRWEYNQVLISSKGLLEDFYGEHLSTIVGAVNLEAAEA